LHALSQGLLRTTLTTITSPCGSGEGLAGRGGVPSKRSDAVSEASRVDAISPLTQNSLAAVAISEIAEPLSLVGCDTGIVPKHHADRQETNIIPAAVLPKTWVVPTAFAHVDIQQKAMKVSNGIQTGH